MKKFATLLLSFLLLLCAFGCGEGSGENGNKKEPLADNSGMIDSKYDLKTYLYPIWEGTTVYNETLWFADGNVAPLLYAPQEVLSVRSYDLKTTYELGKDYVVDGDSIVLTSNSSIPSMTHDEYFPTMPPNPAISVAYDKEAGRYWYINEGKDISSRQVVVTYTHAEREKWTLPVDCSAKFPKSVQKLQNGDPIKVLFYGDSITVGANSSEFLKIEPFAESYANMVKSYLNRRFPNNQMTFANTAVGGTDSNWGAGKLYTPAIDAINAGEGDHFQKRVLDEHPDLLFIAYGMNDQDYTSTRFEDNISEMIQKVRAQNPDVEIMLVSGMIANPETGFYNKDYEAYQQSLVTLAAAYENVGYSTTLSTVSSLYQNGKRFQDCTANNANHPNDFMMRVYAQTLLYSLFGADYIDAI